MMYMNIHTKHHVKTEITQSRITINRGILAIDRQILKKSINGYVMVMINSQHKSPLFFFSHPGSSSPSKISFQYAFRNISQTNS